MTVPRGYIVGASGREISVTDNRTVRRFITTTAKTSTTSRGRRVPDFVVRTQHVRASARCRASRCGCCSSRSTPARISPFRRDRRGVEVLRRMVRRLSLRQHHDRRSRLSERERRHGVSDAVHAGTRWIAPARVTDAGGGHHSRSRTPVLVWRRRQQRVRACVDGRRHQPVLRGACRRSGFRRAELSCPPLFRRLHSVGLPRHPCDRHMDEGLADYRAQAESDAEATPSFRYWPSTGGNITYFKTALWLHTLERSLGWSDAAAGDVGLLRSLEVPSSTTIRFLSGLSDAAGRDTDAVSLMRSIAAPTRSITVCSC